MLRTLLISAVVFLMAPVAFADESEDPANAETGAEPSAETTAETEDAVANGDGIESPKTMSGMSILGNEEAPKALVIIPWKSSELGEDISLSHTLDDRARPVDKEVFLRELSFYDIRSGE